MHRHVEPDRPLGIAVLTVSDTRTEADDEGGRAIAAAFARAGHRVHGARIVPDEPEAIAAAVRAWLSDPECDAVVTTGGTGLAPRDRTPEALRPLLDREIDGFGELFRLLSWQEVGGAAMLSRAFAGVARGKPVFALPGSPSAVVLALERLIVPTIGHLVAELARPEGQLRSSSLDGGSDSMTGPKRDS